MLIPGIRRVVRRYARRSQHRLESWMIDLSGRSSGGVIRLLFGALNLPRLFLVLLLDGLHGEAQIWEGVEIGSGQPMRVAYLADRRSHQVLSPEYLQSILFQPNTVQSFPNGNFSMLRVQAYAQRLACDVDLVIVEANQLLRFRPPRSGQNKWWLVSPWIRMVYDFHARQSWPEIEQAMHAQSKNLKVAKRFTGDLQISHSEEDFNLFYEHMHVPLVEERYGRAAQVEKKEGLRAMFHRGHLMVIHYENQPVAGALNYLRGKSVFGVGLGVLDGDKRWYSLGVLTLLYYHSIRWCFENGMARLDFGGVRPFLVDGLYDYKQRWGFMPTIDPWMERDWLFWIPSPAPAALNWIEKHPFLLPIASHPLAGGTDPARAE